MYFYVYYSKRPLTINLDKFLNTNFYEKHVERVNVADGMFIQLQLTVIF